MPKPGFGNLWRLAGCQSLFHSIKIYIVSLHLNVYFAPFSYSALDSEDDIIFFIYRPTMRPAGTYGKVRPNQALWLSSLIAWFLWSPHYIFLERETVWKLPKSIRFHLRRGASILALASGSGSGIGKKQPRLEWPIPSGRRLVESLKQLKTLKQNLTCRIRQNDWCWNNNRWIHSMDLLLGP